MRVSAFEEGLSDMIFYTKFIKHIFVFYSKRIRIISIPITTQQGCTTKPQHKRL